MATGELETIAGKAPLIKRTGRPPNDETPIEYFAEDFTPNRAFFVRYHLPNIPEVPAASGSLNIGGPSAASPFTLSSAHRRRRRRSR